MHDKEDVHAFGLPFFIPICSSQNCLSYTGLFLLVNRLISKCPQSNSDQSGSSEGHELESESENKVEKDKIRRETV